MVVECGFNMAASNTLSTVNGHAQRRGAGAAGPSNNNNNAVLLSFEQHSHGNYADNNNRQCRAEFLSAKDASRRKRVCCVLDPF